MITVRVPATSANLGPGFDCMGIALSWYTTVQFSLLPSQSSSSLIITGCESQYTNEDNLIYQSFCYTTRKLGKTIPAIAINIASDIPISRGLGSSAACVVAGVFGANELFDQPLSKDELFQIAVELEGHPDNIAPAIYGNLCLSLKDVQQSSTVSCFVDTHYSFTALIPDVQLSTHVSRSVLPDVVTFHDASANIGASLLVLKALELGDLPLLKRVMIDRLHEPYRQHLIPDYQNVRQLMTKHTNSAFYISGAGPTLMLISREQELVDVQTIMKNNSSVMTADWFVKELTVDTLGTIIERSL